MPDSSTRPLALFVSPHLDDVAFSCAGTMASWHRRGGRSVLATVFTRSVPHPTGFALACQLDKGLTAAVDYLALRRGEDADFARVLGVEHIAWLDLPEAPHRGYDSALALFAGVRAADSIALEVTRRLAGLIEAYQPAWIFAPQGIGNHADHLQVIRALIGRPDWLARVAWYRDLPYAAKFPLAQPALDLPADLMEVTCPLHPHDLAAKVVGSLCYRTQVPFQFDPHGGVAAVLEGFAAREGARVGAGKPAETFRVDRNTVASWHDRIGPLV